MSTTLRAALLALVLTVAPVTVGVIVADPVEPPAPPAYTGTALEDYDTSVVAVQRAPFCDLIVPEAVTEALGGGGSDSGAEPEVEANAYGNGDRVRIGGTRDVVHEFGCRYRQGRVAAEAWLFVPPVTEQAAREMVRSAGSETCTPLADAAPFGEPSVAVECPGKQRSVTFQGLFGDAWLSCRVLGPRIPRDDLLDRSGRWCVAVARAASTFPRS